MIVPEEDVKACGTCKAPVVQAVTSRKVKGAPVMVLVEPDQDDALAGTVHNTWALSKIGGQYHAGQVTNRNQRAGMLSSGVRFHVDHKESCGKQPSTKHRYT
jgi:hypothetical protein